MIKLSKSIKEFLNDNKSIFEENPFETQLMYQEALDIIESICDTQIYAGVVYVEKKRMIFLKGKDSYLYLFGNPVKVLMAEFCDITRKYFAECNVSGPEELVNLYLEYSKHKYVFNTHSDILKLFTSNSKECLDIRELTIDDKDEFQEVLNVYYLEAKGDTNIHSALDHLNHYKVYGLIKDNKIVACASIVRSFLGLKTISYVVTMPFARGHGYCQELINGINFLIEKEGSIPSILVNRANPISNRAYFKCGFGKMIDWIYYDLEV